MEALIGVYASQGEYAERLAAYINSRRDIGYGGIAFYENSELDVFFESGRLSLLLTDNPKHLSNYKQTTRVCFLCEEKEQAEDAEDDVFFKYMKAPQLLNEILPSLNNVLSENHIYTVFSPSSNAEARRFARKKAEELAGTGRTLLLYWDPFGAFGRNDEGGVSVSELLFETRRNKKGLKRLTKRMQAENGYYFFKGTDYYSDLWQFTAEEMQELVSLCRKEGDFLHVVFECAYMSEAIERLMEMSDEIFLPKAEDVDPGPGEFLRQMKYAGKQEVLSKVKEKAYG